MKTVLFLLGELNDTDIEWMITTGQKRQLAPGQMLFEENKPVKDLHLILEGLFSITDQEVGGKELARLGVGEVLGEMELVDGHPAAATVKALEPATLLSLSHAQMKERLQRDNGFAARFYKAMVGFLVSRIRGTVSSFSSFNGNGSLDQDTFYQDELDADTLDNLGLAGDRFDRILQRMLAS